MKVNRLNNILGMIFVGLLVCLSIWAIFRKGPLKKNHKICFAKVNDYSTGGKGNAGGIWIDYTIIVDGKSYSSSSSYETIEISPEVVEKYVLQKSFPAVYYPPNPFISSIMILPKDFNKYGYEFPDTLKWILPLLKDYK